jgi:hypothetical protein
MRRLLFCAAIALSSSAIAESPDATAKKEIQHLIAHLGASECKFNRNGSWYQPARAVSHLNTKYEYLLERGWVTSAEAFIERAASESSFSGEPYLVKCGDATAVPSATWLRDELARFRSRNGSLAQQR